MNPPPRMLDVLLRCVSLQDAEDELTELGLTRAQSWGIWDGWTQRPKTMDGLSPGGMLNNRDRVAEGQYDDGFACGARLKSSLTKARADGK